MTIVIPNRFQPRGIANVVVGPIVAVDTDQWAFCPPEEFARAIFGCDDIALLHDLAGITSAKNMRNAIQDAIRQYAEVHLVATPQDWAKMKLTLDLRDPVDVPDSRYMKWRIA